MAKSHEIKETKESITMNVASFYIQKKDGYHADTKQSLNASEFDLAISQDRDHKRPNGPDAPLHSGTQPPRWKGSLTSSIKECLPSTGITRRSLPHRMGSKVFPLSDPANGDRTRGCGLPPQDEHYNKRRSTGQVEDSLHCASNGIHATNHQEITFSPHPEDQTSPSLPVQDPRDTRLPQRVLENPPENLSLRDLFQDDYPKDFKLKTKLSLSTISTMTATHTLPSTPGETSYGRLLREIGNFQQTSTHNNSDCLLFKGQPSYYFVDDDDSDSDSVSDSILHFLSPQYDDTIASPEQRTEQTLSSGISKSAGISYQQAAERNRLLLRNQVCDEDAKREETLKKLQELRRQEQQLRGGRMFPRFSYDGETDQHRCH